MSATKTKTRKLTVAQKAKKAAAEKIRRAAKKNQLVNVTVPAAETMPVKTEIEMSIPAVDFKNGQIETSIEQVKLDENNSVAGTEILPVMSPDIIPAAQSATMADELTTGTKTWNSGEIVTIGLRDPATNVLARFDYVPQVLKVGERTTNYSILTCSDNGAIVGKPFSGSYGLITNNDMLNIVEGICGVLSKLGLKFKFATSGSLSDRERTYISIEIEENSKAIIDGREFLAFLNCLNSIPSNSGCTVTFSNNSFCVCCKNTFAAVLHNRDGSKFHAAIKHTKNVRAALQDIPVLVEAYFASNQSLFTNLKYFSAFPVSLEDCEKFFIAFVTRDNNANMRENGELTTRSANMVEKLKELFLRGKGNKGETALDVFQAITEYYTHFSAGGTKDTDKQFNSSEIGDGFHAKNEFYQWLVKATQSTANFSAVARVGDTILVNYRKKLASKPA